MLPETEAPGGADVVSPFHSAANMSLALGRNSSLTKPILTKISQIEKKIARLRAVIPQAP